MAAGRMRLLAAAAGLTAAFAAAPVYAQGHKGGYVGGGVGWGSADATCDNCGTSDKRESSVAYNLRAGVGLTNQFLVGVEFNGWQKSKGFDDSSDLSVKMYNLAATITLYPTGGGFFVKGGGGLSILKAEASGGGVSAAFDTAKGPGFIAGAGYDIPAGAHVSITPAINYWYGKPGDLRFQGTLLDKGWTQNVVDVTIGVTFR